jgi:UDP-glucose 4-epimerase
MAAERIFISGVAGFLGSHLADAFLADGHQVVGIDSMVGGDLRNVPSAVEFHQTDCNDLAAVRQYMRGVDVVFHCAATAYEGVSVFLPHLVTQNIVTASTGMISAALSQRVRRFVLCSSMARYGANPVPFTEDMTPQPQDPYGIGKYASELLLRNLAEAHGMEWVIAVPHNVFGPRQKYDDPYRNVAAIFINLMLQNCQPRIYGNGEQRRCFSYVSDVVQPLKQMAFEPNCHRQIINVGPDADFITINALAQKIASLLGFDLDAVHLPGRPQEVSLANCSADRARRLLGYRPRISLDEGLRRTIDWMRARGPRQFQFNLGLEIVTDQTPATWTRGAF